MTKTTEDFKEFSVTWTGRMSGQPLSIMLVGAVTYELIAGALVFGPAGVHGTAHLVPWKWITRIDMVRR